MKADFKDFMIAERQQEALLEAQADMREVLFKQQLQEIITPNQEGDRCAFCERKGEIPIQDEDTHRTLYICEYCDSELNYGGCDDFYMVKGIGKSEVCPKCYTGNIKSKLNRYIKVLV